MRDGSGIELENVEQLGEEIEIYHERKANAEGIKKEIEQLSKTPKKQQTVEQKQLLSKLEKRAANPYIREWAADHGFDEMGTVAYDKSGRPIPGSYVPGRDDAAIEKHLSASISVVREDMGSKVLELVTLFSFNMKVKL